jgi:hypothetical protein
MVEPLQSEARPAVAWPTRMSPGLAQRVVRGMAAQDWLIGAYLFAMLIAIVFGSGPHRFESGRTVAADLTIYLVGVLLVRGQLVSIDSLPGSLLYRLATAGPVITSYFQLQDILPAVTSRAIDRAIFGLDMRVFGVEPALAWDAYVTPTTTEWFAFFYFSYFFLLAVHVLPCVSAGSDGRMNARFAFGAYFIFCVAHVLYMVVPGFGPYRYLAGQFAHALEGKAFWPLVVQTVVENGAQKDIFPSVHTAIPTYCTLFAFLHRDRPLFRRAFPILLFWTSQIVIATMFLRWHYLIDIVAGVTLATAAARLTCWLEPREHAHRMAQGLGSIFGPFPIKRAPR